MLQFHEGEADDALACSCCHAAKALAYHHDANKHRSGLLTLDSSHGEWFCCRRSIFSFSLI